MLMWKLWVRTAKCGTFELAQLQKEENEEYYKRIRNNILVMPRLVAAQISIGIHTYLLVLPEEAECPPSQRKLLSKGLFVSYRESNLEP